MHGWRAVIILLTFTAACAGVATWALMAVVIPVITEARFAWPLELIALWPSLLVGGYLTAFVLQAITHYSSWWTDRLPVVSDAPDAAAVSGAAVGAIVATCTMQVLLGIVLGGAATVILAILAVRLVRSAVYEIRDEHDEIDRIDDLYDRGTQVRAEVEKVDFLDSWNNGSPLFEVVASYDTPSGPCRATGVILTSPAGAPVVGGTVRLWFLGDGSDTENIDLNEDPKSIRDPDAATKYEVPSV